MAEFLQTMNLFRKLTHHRFHQRTRLGIVVRNVSVGRRPTNLATLYSLPRHSSIPSTGKNACFALYEVLRLFVSYLSLRRETIVQFLSSRRGFPAFSILINDSRFSLSLLRTTGLAHVRVTYAITLDLCKCVEDTRARAHSWAARCRLKPFHFTSRPRFKKLSLSLTFGSIVYRLSNDPLRFPFPRSLVSFFFQ